MATRTLQSSLPPTFTKLPERDVSSRLAGERNVVPAKTIADLRSKETGIPKPCNQAIDWNTTTWVWVIIVPIAVWCLLLVLMPTFVKKDESTSKLDHQSLLTFTLIISVVIWILFFGFAKCKTC